MKTLEDHLNLASEEVRRASSQLPPVRTPENHPVRKRLAAAVGVAATIGLLVVPLILLNSPSVDQIGLSDVGQGENILLADPLVVRGEESPEPVFDTSSLGVEVPLLEPSDIQNAVRRVEENLLSPEDEVVKHVVAGALASGSQAGIVQTAGERGWCLWIIPPTDARPSCSGRNNNEPKPLIGVHPGTDFPAEGDELQGTFAWGPLGTDVSVVAVIYGDTALWQRPVGGIALFDISNPNQEHITYTAYDRDGNVLTTGTATSWTKPSTQDPAPTSRSTTP